MTEEREKSRKKDKSEKEAHKYRLGQRTRKEKKA